MFEAPFGFIVQFCVAFLVLGLINFIFLIVYRCVYGQNCYLLSNFSGTFISGLYFRFHTDGVLQFQLAFVLILSCQFVWYTITYRRSAAAWQDPLGQMQPPWTALGTAKGIVCFFLAFFCYKYSSEFLRFLNDPSRRALTLYTDFIYQHQIGYEDLCRQHGYQLRLYPAYFEARYRDDIDWLDNEWHRNGLSLIEAHRLIYRTRGFVLRRRLNSHLKRFKTYLIQNKLAEQNISDTDGTYAKTLDEKIGMYDVCRIFDKTAPLLLESQTRHRDFIRLMKKTIRGEATF